MENFIEDLFFGELDPQASVAEFGCQYNKALSTISVNEELLTKSLKGKELKLFLDFVNAWDELTGITSCEFFTRGFRTGASFALDTFVNN